MVKNILLQLCLMQTCLTGYTAPESFFPDFPMRSVTIPLQNRWNPPAEPDSVFPGQSLFPAAFLNEIILRKTAYTVSYNCRYNLANWVAYTLTAAHTRPLVKRKNNFAADPALGFCTVVPGDYARSGYDKGHLAPSADMCWSATTMNESFYMTNMTPQKPRFNRGIWKRLEDQVRDWAVENDSVFVITGPVPDSAMRTIGKDSVSVPPAFFKVIVDLKGPELKGIAFVMANKRLTGNLTQYAVTIDSVETITGIDFFASLPDDEEVRLESTLNLLDWLWNGKPLKPEDETDDD